MSTDKKHRTWLCSVLFTDIVSYTKFDVEEQMDIRRHFYDLVEEELKNYNRDDYITLDAGDGMAICYLGDPEDVLLMALSLRDAFIRIKTEQNGVNYEVRLGINLGPVKIAELQGEKRVIGDAINVANRIMGFAGPNELYISRSYYEVVSHLSKEYFNMFDFVGTREDKHVRKHDLYTVSTGTPTTSESSTNPPSSDASPQRVISTTLTGQKNATSIALNSDQLKKIELCLSEFIGPLAKILIRKRAEKAKNLPELYQRLSEEIEITAERDRFLAACRKLKE